MPILLLVLLTALAACAPAPAVAPPATAPVETGDPDLDAARAQWAAAALDDYAMTITRLCFCPPEYRGPYEVEVEGGEIASVRIDGRDATSGTPPTVDALFDLLADAYARGAARVDVTYHPDLGAPLSLYIDYDERLADEEVGYTVSALQPAPARR